MLQSMEWQSLTLLSYWTTAKNASSTLKGPAALLTDCSGQEGAAEGTPAAGGGKPREKGLQLRSCQDWREEQEEMNRQTSSASSTGQALCQAFYKSYLALIKKKTQQWLTTILHRELHSIFLDKSWWKRILKRMYICVSLSHYAV